MAATLSSIEKRLDELAERMEQSVFDTRSAIKQNGHKTVIGSWIGSNYAVIATIAIAAAGLSRQVGALENKVVDGIPQKIQEVETRLDTAIKTERDTRTQDVDRSRSERAMMFKESDGRIESTYRELTARLNGIVRVCCPKGTEVGAAPGENPIYCGVLLE